MFVSFGPCVTTYCEYIMCNVLCTAKTFFLFILLQIKFLSNVNSVTNTEQVAFRFVDTCVYLRSHLTTRAQHQTLASLMISKLHGFFISWTRDTPLHVNTEETRVIHDQCCTRGKKPTPKLLNVILLFSVNYC